MQKIKYIIIFTLVLALGMVYVQLLDYQKITTTLLENNANEKNKTTLLQNKIISLDTQNQELQNKIISLEETINLNKLQLHNNYSNDNNESNKFQLNTIPLNNEINPEIPETNLTPNITLDNENEITGFGLEYNQKF